MVKTATQYFSPDLNCMVQVFPEKKVKRIPWQRGEVYLSIKMRIPAETGVVMYQFTRKNGKY